MTAEKESGADVAQKEPEIPFKPQIVWRSVYNLSVLHLAALYGLYLAIFYAKWQTILFAFFLYVLGGLGITAGAHRLWSHRSYKAAWPLRAILVVFNCIAFQNDVIEWSRDHRGHHKWSESDADPHNSARGFFFAHMGWLMVKKHPEVIKKGKTLDLSDLSNDPLLRWQRRWYKPLVLFLCFVLPTVICVKGWGENGWTALLVAGILKYVVTLHITWSINSLAHFYGYRPYDAKINPRENILTSLGALGEGWHNYHHTFPQDYKTAELPYTFNFTTVFIDFFITIGLAYGQKETPKETIERQKAKHGE